MKSIKNLIKVVMISGIVVMFNICNVINGFASSEVKNNKVETIDDYKNIAKTKTMGEDETKNL